MKSPQEFLVCQVVDWYMPDTDNSQLLRVAVDTSGREAEPLERKPGAEITELEGSAQ